MKTTLKIIVPFSLLSAGCLAAFAQGTAFTYQGRLNDGNGPASGSYDLTFSLFNASSSGALVAGPETNLVTAVSNGTFNVMLDFGPGVFTGGNYWLEIGVRTNGNGSFTTLAPRQPVLPTPYAIYSANAGNATTATTAVTASSANSATTAGSATTATTANNFSGLLSGDVTGTQGATVVSTVGGVTAANVASGANAANALLRSDGNANFFSGPSAGNLTASGQGNTANGYLALRLDTSGQANTAAGDNALYSNTTGNNNTAIGYQVMQANTSGSGNTAIGLDALLNNDTGNYNIAIGDHAGFNIGFFSAAGSSNIDIGNLGVANDTGIIRIGDGQTQTFIAGVINGDGGGLTNLAVTAAGITGTLSLSQMPSAVVTNGASGVNLSGNISGNGSGLTNVPGTLVPQTGAGTNAQAQANTSLLLTNSGMTTVTLPGNANVGDVVEVSGQGAGGWSVVAPSPNWFARENNRNWSAIASSADGTRLAATVNGGQINVSSDSGFTWTPRGPVANWNSIACSTDGRQWLASVSGGLLYISSDYGTNWIDAGAGSDNWVDVASSTNGSVLVAVTSGLTANGICISKDSGNSWQRVIPGGTVYYSGFGYYDNQYESWNSVAVSGDGSHILASASQIENIFWHPYEVYNGSYWYVAYYYPTYSFGSGELYQTINSGSSWSQFASGQPWGQVAISTDGSAGVAFGFNINGIAASSTAWSGPIGPTGASFAFAVSADCKQVVASVSGNVVNFTNSTGSQWSSSSSSAPNDVHLVCLSSSADASTIAGVVSGGQIYIRSSLIYHGLQGNSTAFQYLGNGQWQPLNPVPVGSVSSADIVNGAVGSAQLAPSFAITGQINAGSISGRGALLWQVVTSGTQATANAGYLVNSLAQVTITLPATPTAGDVVRVAGLGVGGWKIAQNSGQSVLAGNAVMMSQKMVWTPHDSSRNWETIASSADGSKLAAANNGGYIYTSTDSGNAFVSQSSGARAWRAMASSADGNKLVAVGNAISIYTSSDAGNTWTSHASSRAWTGVASSADGVNLAATVNGGQIWTSPDSGVTWNAQATNRAWMDIAGSADGTKLVAVVTNGLIYTSSDSGVTWTATGTNQAWTAVASSAGGSRLAAAVGGGQIYMSSDSGVTWTPNGPSLAWTSIASSADGMHLLAAASGGQLYVSGDAGASWTAQDSNRSWNAVASSADGSRLSAVEYGGQIYTSSYTPAGLGVSTTSGIAGYLSGGAGSAIELVSIGNGQWLPVSHEGSIFGY